MPNYPDTKTGYQNLVSNRVHFWPDLLIHNMADYSIFILSMQSELWGLIILLNITSHWSLHIVNVYITYYSVSTKMWGKYRSDGIRLPDIYLFTCQRTSVVHLMTYDKLSWNKWSSECLHDVCMVFTPKVLCVLHTLNIFKVYWLRRPLL